MRINILPIVLVLMLLLINVEGLLLVESISPNNVMDFVLCSGFIKLLSKIKKLEKKVSKLWELPLKAFGFGKRSAEVELLNGFDGAVHEVNKSHMYCVIQTIFLRVTETLTFKGFQKSNTKHLLNKSM